MKNALVLTDRNFKKEVFESEIPVLVDFWASWCPPCKMAESVIEELAKEYDTKLKVGKLNVDLNPKIADEFSIGGVPTFMVFKSGKILASRAGAQSKGQIKEMINEAMSSDSVQKRLE